MKHLLYFLYFSLFFFHLSACKKDKEDMPPVNSDFLQLISVKVGTENLDSNSEVEINSLDQPLVARFTKALNINDFADFVTLKKNATEVLPFTVSFLDNNKSASIQPDSLLEPNTQYEFSISNELRGSEGEEFGGVIYHFKTKAEPLEILSIEVDGKDLRQTGKVTDVSRMLDLDIEFSHPVNLEDLKNNLTISNIPVSDFIFSQQGSTFFNIKSNSILDHLRPYNLNLRDNLASANGNPFEGFQKRFYTEIDSTYKFPELSEDALLTHIQENTFKYFWDFGHPVSGLSRERNTSNNTVTSGGSGFGLMAIVVGIERGFITRSEGLQRLQTIVNFLENADRFHGVWSHWLNGETGAVIPFSPKDNGGDLVETSYLVMGLLTVRQYLNDQNPQEQLLIDQINMLWESVEWDWYQQGQQNVLYWHWSPEFEWEINLKIRGYNEALITYILAASSPTHAIPAAAYHNGWAAGGNMINGNNYFGINLPLGPNLGGPLFFEQYTFLGIDPRSLSDNYANYWTQVVNHTLINRMHCIENPNQHVGYNSSCWGLTASDGNQGYSAHSPTNDRGVITPTAALSSMPFTPDESMDALQHFYYVLGDKLWGEYGFYDAFNINEGWVADSFLAIDQGPILLMIENHRSSLLWDLFMSCPEVQTGLTTLGFSF